MGSREPVGSQFFKKGRESSRRYGHLGLHAVPQSAIRVGDAKRVKLYEGGEVELFDLSPDLGETTDISAVRRDETTALRNRLESHLLDVDAKVPVTPVR